MKTKIHFGRIIMYAILFAIVISLYRFLHSHLFFMILIIMAAGPVVSIGLCFYLRKVMSIDVLTPENEVNKDEISFVFINVKNPSFFMSLDVKIKLKIENIFFGNKREINISVPTRMHNDYEVKLPLKLSMNGVVRYSIDSFTLLDLLGFIEIKKKNESKREVNVFPYIRGEEEEKFSDLAHGMTESEETNKKGHDFSDVNDVREYIPGDKLMSIHWKLSAKRDILMVKDRVSMSDQQLVIVTELSGEPSQVDEVITLAYALCRKNIEEKIFVKLIWWSEARYEFVVNQLMNIDDLKAAYSRMYYEKIYENSEKTVEYMRNVMPELKAYIHVFWKEGEADVEICEQE